MMIHATLKRFSPLFFATCLVAVITSCGGGGSSGGGGTSSSSSVDSTPNAITFAPVTNAKASTEVTSAPVALVGFNQSVSISISGGSYSIGGTDFKTTAGTVINGQVVTVKLTSSNKTSTATTATLTVGGVSGQFTVTTEADVTPDAFTFTSVTGVGAKAVTTSNEITVTGIDVAVPVSITNGEYKIGSGDFTNVSGTVNKDQKITVRATSSDKPSTDVTAVLIIGGVTGSFVVTTTVDDVAPTAQILFPPPVSMTEGNTILVRGSASDEFSAIESVKVNGVAATTTDGFKNWQALVLLADSSKPITVTTENTLKVVTEDSIGNISGDGIQVKIIQADIGIAFPNAQNSFKDIAGIALDQLDGRNRVLVDDRVNGLVAVDLDSGERTIFSDIEGLDGIVVDYAAQRLFAVKSAISGTRFFDFDLKDGSKYNEYIREYMGDSDPYALAINTMTSPVQIVGVSSANGDIYSTTSVFGTLNPFSTPIVPNGNNVIAESYGIAYDKKNNRYLVTGTDQHQIFSVDAAAGGRSVFSSNSVGTGEWFGEFVNPLDAVLTAIQIDEANQRAVAFEIRSGKLFGIDLATGNRSLISSVTESNSENTVRDAYGLAIVSSDSYALVSASQSSLQGLFAIDLVTGKRVILSKSAGVAPY